MLGVDPGTPKTEFTFFDSITANFIYIGDLIPAISKKHKARAMRKNNFLFFGLLFLTTTISAQVKVVNLLTENQTNPIGLDVQQPRFSWQLVSDQRNISQTAYEITISASKGTAWKSGKIMSDRSVQVPYAGAALQSGKKYTWEVRVWDNNGKPSPWSEPAFFQTALRFFVHQHF